MVKQSRHRSHHQFGVTSIEYALIASLIAIVILASLQATGTADGGLWGAWTDEFIAAVNGVLGP
ncbi:MAG: Flp family type IVb pilin [Polaromonas sp.]